MRLIKTIKPQIFSGKTKDEVIQKMSVGKHYTISVHNGYKFYGYTDDKYKYAFNFEKRRRKMKNLPNRPAREMVQQKEWIGRVYKFPKDFPIEIKQHPRHFDFKY